jgi:hypothetical protein
LRAGPLKETILPGRFVAARTTPEVVTEIAMTRVMDNNFLHCIFIPPI